jgi:transcription elongation factor Elf1
MFYHHNKSKELHRFSCTNCDSFVTVDFSKVKRDYVAVCKKCGEKYPFSVSDVRLIRAQKKHIK